LRSVSLFHQFLSELGQPPLHSVLFDILEPDPIDAGRTCVGFRLPVGPLQGLDPAHLVVQRIETEVRLPLGLLIELLPESLDLIGF